MEATKVVTIKIWLRNAFNAPLTGVFRSLDPETEKHALTACLGSVA